MAGSGIALAQMGNVHLNPWTESKVDTKNPHRGPLLILDGEKDHTVPWAIAGEQDNDQRAKTDCATAGSAAAAQTTHGAEFEVFSN